MNSVLQDLLKLQALDFSDNTDKDTEAQAAELRGKIPQPVIGHYDRLRVRGKRTGNAQRRGKRCREEPRRGGTRPMSLTTLLQVLSASF